MGRTSRAFTEHSGFALNSARRRWLSDSETTLRTEEVVTALTLARSDGHSELAHPLFNRDSDSEKYEKYELMYEISFEKIRKSMKKYKKYEKKIFQDRIRTNQSFIDLFCCVSE